MTWLPDGRRVAFVSKQDDWVSGNARALTSHGDHIDVYPSWSPDSRSIAFQRHGPSGTRIGIVPADGGALRFLPLPSDAFGPAWSPDGKNIAVLSAPDGERDVFIVTPLGEIVSRIRRQGADRNPAWIRRATP